MATRSILRIPLFCLISAAILLMAARVDADIVVGDQPAACFETEQSALDIIQFLEPESSNLLNFKSESNSVEATIVLPYSLYQENQLTVRIPEPSHWPFLVFCTLIWGFVYAGRSGRPLRHTC